VGERPLQARSGFVGFDLRDLRPRWMAWCESVGTSPSEAFRRIVRSLKLGKWPSGAGREQSTPPADVRSKAVCVRLKVPLTADESTALYKAASRDGLPPPRWIVALIRANVFNRAQPTAHAVEALNNSNFQVQAIGRNLNQLVRALNAIADHLDNGRLKEAGDGLRTHWRRGYLDQLVHEVRGVIDRHLPLVTDVLTDSERRWRRRSQGETGDGAARVL
jgi:hypothetical protein